MTRALLVQADEQGVVTVTLNRPEKLNALTKDLWRELGVTFRALDADGSVRCIVLRGAGGKSFSPGNDISEFETGRATEEQARTYGRIMHDTLSALTACRHPLIALIEGICVGGGLECAAVCDLRICGESSRFGVPVARLGLVMAHAELAGLLRLVGPATALEILLEARVFDAAEAKDKGLVSRVVSDDQVEVEAYSAARRIAAGGPLVHRWHKKFVRQLEEGRELTDLELREGFACFGTEDFRIGYRAFLSKEEPRFVGR